jgi:DNA-binding beta-propeller fold protein YncE
MVPESRTSVSGGPAPLTRRERKRRWWLLGILLLLLALLAYSTYYYFQNRRLPLTDLGRPDVVDPPRFLYAITGSGDDELRIPLGVGVADDGRVYVVDFGRRRIAVFTNQGRFITAFNELADGTTLGNPVQVTIHAEEVWVTDRRLRTIEVFDLEGEHLRTFDSKDVSLKNWSPLSVAFAKDGRFFVTDVGDTDEHRVHYFSSEGSHTITIGRTYQANSLEEEPGGFFYPTGAAVADDGRVYVSDGNNRRVQVFDETGAFKKFVDTSGIPRGIDIDKEQRLYVVDAIAHTVDVYDLEGQRLTQFGSRGIGPGQFNYANYIDLDRRSRIYVSDRENNQVQVWGWPVAEPPIPALPESPWGWLPCLAPLLLFPLLLLRKRRIVVTPDFVEALVSLEQIDAVSKKSRLRLVAPVEDRHHYQGRVEQEVGLEDLIDFAEYSESDARAMAEKYRLAEREAMLLTMAERAHGLGTQDVELQRLATIADIRSMDVEEFLEQYVGQEKKVK